MRLFLGGSVGPRGWGSGIVEGLAADLCVPSRYHASGRTPLTHGGLPPRPTLATLAGLSQEGAESESPPKELPPQQVPYTLSP